MTCQVGTHEDDVACISDGTRLVQTRKGPSLVCSLVQLMLMKIMFAGEYHLRDDMNIHLTSTGPVAQCRCVCVCVYVCMCLYVCVHFV